ncbi:nuclear transport factor 2 family protein [Paludisphaera mucosa]|uniref:Pyrrolidone-carboxylate peptidase n=1 Tax=Paludisphaera mucosa TaxID=3030827 RepID=A0ABT6FF04_9BACT|nr:nuclear transport factor 2 family protein [Paludisphaera mucosa]MDG3006157.1 nuclear transport factor 2 family protein [Paludisphaera mucosa]
MSLSFLLRAWPAVAFLAVVWSFGGRPAVAADLPTILLTGFEPFGKEKPPNPSWEGIKALDGREWNGFRLVARQLPVVWDEPLKRVEALVAELHPAAVFAFGQGRKDAFTVEGLARRDRWPFPDESGAKPRAPAIADGPLAFLATSDVERLVKTLAAKGQPVRLSDDAGRYLCEELLYSLEYLKKAGKIRGPVLFCHVPPLGVKLKDEVVDAARVEKFVLDVLDAWREIDGDASRPKPEAAVRSDAVVRPVAFRIQAPAADATAREKEARAFVERYFKVWSDRDMDGYDDCFMTDASIQHIDGQGQLFTIPRPRFVASQRDAHRRSPSRMIEVPESIEIRFEQELARAVVYWKLTAGDRVQKGYDHFTLRRDRGRWRIVNLLFYSTDEE